MKRFLIIIEKAKSNYSAYSPDIPGCIATGKTRDEAAMNMHEAIAFHIQGLREERKPIPKSYASAEFVAV